jgi:hypothetical protein
MTPYLPNLPPLPDDFRAVLRDVFTSPVEYRRDGQPANVADGLFAIARALDRLAQALEAQVRRG